MSTSHISRLTSTRKALSWSTSQPSTRVKRARLRVVDDLEHVLLQPQAEVLEAAALGPGAERRHLAVLLDVDEAGVPHPLRL